MDAVTLKALLLDSIKKNIGVNFTFTEEGECLLEEAASEADDKRRAALIINALNVTDNGQVENKYDPEYYIYELVDDLYDEDDPEESTLRKPELDKIEAHQVIDVEYRNHLPISITLSELEYPITSIAFMGVIKKVYFGDPKVWIYDSASYKDAYLCLEKLGIHIPESVFQYHFFISCVLGYCRIFEYLLKINDLFDESRLSPLITRLKCPNECGVDQKENQSRSGLEKGNDHYQELIDYIFQYAFGVITDKNIVLFTADRAQGGLFFNEGQDRFMGFYWEEGGETIYRSLPDYVNSTLSADIESFLLLAAFRAFVDLNKVIINDGVDYLKGTDGVGKLSADGVRFNSEEDISRCTIGWLHESLLWEG